MHELFKIILLFLLGSIAGFINVMAGGGSSLVLPVLMIFFGLDGVLANGTNRIAILIQNFTAVLSFKQEKYHQFKLSLKLSLLTLPGAIIGTLFAVRISNELFQKILAIVMIGIMVTILFPRFNKTKIVENPGYYNPWLLYPAMFGIGFYGGFIQVGVGFILLATLIHIMKLDLVRVNMHKVFIIFIYTIPAVTIFILTGNVKWSYGFILAAGNAVGAWWSAKIAVRKGEKVIRIVLLVAIFIMALKLLKVF